MALPYDHFLQERRDAQMSRSDSILERLVELDKTACAMVDDAQE